MTRSVAIHQPNFLPWCGYFAKMRSADLFVFLDDAAISRRSYVSRTKIRHGDASHWLTVPTSMQNYTPINAVRFADDNWPAKHLATLRHTYARAPHFSDIMSLLEPEYDNLGDHLSAFNIRLVRTIAQYLGITATIRSSSEFAVQSAGADRLIELVKAVGGTTYISGQGGTNYQDPSKFAASEIDLDVRIYDAVSYSHKGFDFQPGLSIVDALFIKGRSALDLLTYS